VNVPPLLGKHILSYGLGRRRNMTQVGSDNWSGYADINGTYSSVSSTWTEPSVSCTQSSGSGGFLGLFGTAGGYNTTYSSFWIGLRLEQCRADGHCGRLHGQRPYLLRLVGDVPRR